MGVAYDLPSFFQVVQPMKHPLGDRMPLFLWNLPMPVGQQLIWSRQSGSLRKAIDELAQRGIVPMVHLPGGSGGLALAQTLQEAGRPIYLLNDNVTLIESTAWRNCTVWADGPDFVHNNHPRRWPCLPMADPQPGANWVTQQVVPFKQTGIAVSGVFFDDEGLPYSSNGIYEATANAPQIRAQYPPGTFDSPDAFARYTLRLHEKLERQILVEPVHQLYPQALVGQYGDIASAQNKPGSWGYPPRSCEGDLAMPSLYAHNALLLAALRPGETLTQQRADEIYFSTLLDVWSPAAADARAAHKKLVPYVGQVVFDDWRPAARFGLSRGKWRELQYHLWLRGADGLFLFNLGFPTSGVTPDFSFRSVEDARQVYDTLLAHREFLDKGEPMNYAVGAMIDGQPIWSGLRLPDRCLVRAFTPGEKGSSVKIPAFENVSVTVEAPPEGALYLIGKDGSVKKTAP